MVGHLILVLALATVTLAQVPIQTPDGIFVGSFRNYFNDVKGDVYVVDDNTLLIKGFGYDGSGPDAYFWACKRPTANHNGTLIPYELDQDGKQVKLGRYSEDEVTLDLPDGIRASEIKNLSVWCYSFRVNFGDVIFPDGVGDLL